MYSSIFFCLFNERNPGDYFKKSSIVEIPLSHIFFSVDTNQKKGRVIKFPKFRAWYAAAALLLFS
jgi:hypothetical protein